MHPRLESYAYALLRIVAGVMFVFHSFSKLFDWHGGAKAVGSQLWIGGVIELVAGTLIALGLFTRPAALLASGTMAVAYIQFHWKFDLSEAFWPIVNQGETALLYAFVFLLFAASGAGVWSLDGLRKRSA